MKLYAKLFGLRILGYCLMDNHFHILVEVPRRPEVPPSNEELVALVRATLGQSRADNLAKWFAIWEDQENRHAIEAERERWFRQMWNLAAFMKVLKQRFSQWFNRTRPTRRTGTLWEDRYRSVLVEHGAALPVMAAYIDLNPVRGGKVGDPKEYPWSGYGAAMAGCVEAQAGLRWIAEHANADGLSPAATPSTGIDAILAWYREHLYIRGEEVRNAEGAVVKRGFNQEAIREVLKMGGRLPIADLLRLRVRAFTDGAVLGGEPFVEAVFQAYRSRFSAKRLSGSRRLASLDLDSPLRVARELPLGAEN